ncbi:MAG: DUF294 nucleotidyltransferase-like domain-containing protein [Alphaproteobacteria bacterium]
MLQPFEIKKKIKQEREELLSQFRDGTLSAHEFTRTLSSMVDGYVSDIASATLGDYQDKVALLYTGSNGRHEVCPYSDLDLTVLLDESLETGAGIGTEAEIDKEFYENAFNPFFTALTDAGFVPEKVWPMGQTYAINMMLEDQENWTQFIDRRFSGWGNPALYESLDQAIHSESESNKVNFFTGKFDEYDKRLQTPAYGERSPSDTGKDGGRFTVLEPDVKKGYGGLRGYQTAQWVAQEQCGAGGCDITGRGLMSIYDEERAQEAHEFLLTVRCHLHDLEGKEKDRMESHRQPEIASRMGYDDATSFMRDYIHHTRHIAYYAKIVCSDVAEQAGIKPPGDFSDEYIHFPDDKISEPMDILNIYQQRLETGNSLHHSAIREICHNLDMVDTLADNEDANSVMLNILSSEDCETVLRYMNIRGVLPRMIPEFGEISALTHFDPHHTYTVDEHSIVAVGHLGRIIKQEHCNLASIASGLSGNVSQEDKEVLSVALLLHDVHKSTKPEHNSLYNEELIGNVGKRLGLSDEQSSMASWIGKNHLLLSHTARYQDLEDSAVVQNFVDTIPDKKHLDNLMMFTIADSLALGPGRLSQHAVYKIESLYEKAQGRLLGLTPNYNTQSSTQMPEDYVDGTPYVCVADNELSNSTLITVITPDKPYLMENITGALAQARCDVLNARVTTVSNGNIKAINHFLVQSNQGEMVDMYAKDGVQAAVMKAIEADERLKFNITNINADTKRKNQVFGIEADAEFSNALSDTSTLVKVVARDRPDLLHILAKNFNDLGLKMSHATVTTQGHKATDVFNVENHEGGQIPVEMQKHVRDTIMQLIQEDNPSLEA